MARGVVADLDAEDFDGSGVEGVLDDPEPGDFWWGYGCELRPEEILTRNAEFLFEMRHATQAAEMFHLPWRAIIDHGGSSERLIWDKNILPRPQCRFELFHTVKSLAVRDPC